MSWLPDVLGALGLICLIAAVTWWSPILGLGFTGVVLVGVAYLIAYLRGPSDGNDPTG